VARDSGIPGNDSGLGGTKSGGCGCAIASGRPPSRAWPALLLVLVVALSSRRRG
jgi:MYXO-CTERM domain-containing protein